MLKNLHKRFYARTHQSCPVDIETTFLTSLTMSEATGTKNPEGSETVSENNVAGLSTPALTNGEFIDASSEMPPKEEEKESQNPSIIEIAGDLEANIKQMMEMMEKNDNEVSRRLDDLGDRIEVLRRKCATSSQDK